MHAHTIAAVIGKRAVMPKATKTALVTRRPAIAPIQNAQPPEVAIDAGLTGSFFAI